MKINALGSEKIMESTTLKLVQFVVVDVVVCSVAITARTIKTGPIRADFVVFRAGK